MPVKIFKTKASLRDWVRGKGYIDNCAKNSMSLCLRWSMDAFDVEVQHDHGIIHHWAYIPKTKNKPAKKKVTRRRKK